MLDETAINFVFNYFIFCGWITILSSWEYLKPNKDYFLQQMYLVLKIIKSYIFEIENRLFLMTYAHTKSWNLSLGVVHKRRHGLGWGDMDLMVTVLWPK